MCSPQQLREMAARLVAAARSRDWAALERIDREVAGQFPALARAPGSAPERAALQQLRAAHAMALQLCVEAGEALQRDVARLRTDREGWLAYAQHDGALAAQELRP